MAATDYFVTPTDIGRGVTRLRIGHVIGIAVGITAAIAVLKFTTLGTEAAIFTALLLALMIWRSDPRWLFGAAIGSFGAIIIVSTLWRDVEIFNKPLSERMAVWSFYFLVIGVMLLIVESYWPKDGTFNALQQKAPTAAGRKKDKHLPAHIKAKLKQQREERAAAEAAAQAKGSASEGSFKHPLFANGQPPIGQTSKSAQPTAKQQPLSDRSQQSEPPFQYIAQTPPKLRPQTAPQPLPVAAASTGRAVGNANGPVSPRQPVALPAKSLQPAAESVAKPIQPVVAQPPVRMPVQPVTQQPRAYKEPPLLDLRKAPRTGPMPKKSIVVTVKSDSPLPSRRRKLVQL